MTELSKQQIIDKLSAGWELRNRGTGWWVCEPLAPYKRPASEPVSEAIFNELEAMGVIETELLSTSAVAKLKR